MSDLPPKLISADPSVHLASDNVSKGEGEKTAFSVPLPWNSRRPPLRRTDD
jgi:hypothetical protein